MLALGDGFRSEAEWGLKESEELEKTGGFLSGTISRYNAVTEMCEP